MCVMLLALITAEKQAASRSGPLEFFSFSHYRDCLDDGTLFFFLSSKKEHAPGVSQPPLADMTEETFPPWRIQLTNITQKRCTLRLSTDWLSPSLSGCRPL